jgi:hypothetical protein
MLVVCFVIQPLRCLVCFKVVRVIACGLPRDTAFAAFLRCCVLSRWFDLVALLEDDRSNGWALQVAPMSHAVAGASVLHLLAHRGGPHTKTAWYRGVAETTVRKDCEQY